MVALPREILRIVFAYMTKKDLYTCMFVSKAWYSDLSVVLYRQVIWPGYYTLRHVQRALMTRIDGNKLGKYVNMIHFADYGHMLAPSFTIAEFKQLIYNLPHLQIIEIAPLFMGFLKAIPKDKLNAVQEISIISGRFRQQDVNDHLTVNLQLKDQITTLKLETLDIPLLGGVFERLLPILSTFPLLTALIVGGHLYFTNNKEEECINITSILNHCSSLVFLDFSSGYKWLIPTEESAIHTNLSFTRIKVPNFTEEHMEYMMKCMPHVEQLNLEITRRNFEEQIIRLEPSVVKKFSMYLRKMNYLEIQSGLYHQHPYDNVSAISTAMAGFWNFMRDVCGKDCSCALFVNFADYAIFSGAHFTKKYTNLHVGFDIMARAVPEDDDFFIRQLEFLTFTSIEIGDGTEIDDNSSHSDDSHSSNSEYSYSSNRRRMNHSVDSKYSSLLQPFIKLLLQQQNDKACPLKVDSQPQRLVFHHSLLSSVLTSEQTTDRSIHDYGYIESFTLRNNMLKDLGRLYSSVKYLIFKHCILTMEDSSSYYYQIDLSTFTNVEELEIDFNASFGTENSPIETAYIRCVNIIIPQATTYYYYCQNALTYLGTQDEVSIPDSSCKIQIYHERLQKLSICK